MDASSAKKNIDDLSNALRQHNTAYYRDNDPTISDEGYDALFKALQALESKYPDLAQPDSPTKGLGEEVLLPTNGKIRHQTPLLSIDNTFDIKGVEKFDADMKRLAQGMGGDRPKEIMYCAEKKFDGLAVSLIYKNGKLVSAATRGDYEVGEDVTSNAWHIESIPTEIDYKGDLDVRGEIMMDTEAFISANIERETQGKKLLSNARNAAAGAMSTKDPSETGRRGLSFHAYGISDATIPSFALGEHFESIPYLRESEAITSQRQVLDWLKQNGFPADEPVMVQGEFGMQSYYEITTKNRHLLPYDIDGVVFKVDSLELQREAGFTSRTPRYMLAYKFNQQETNTVVLGIDLQIGRTGSISPVARLKPVVLGGVVVENATLHNQFEIAKKDIRVGDVVLLRRGGDVIPGVVSVDVKARGDKQLPEFSMPSACPCCGSAVEHGGDGQDAVARCSGGPSKCSEQRYQQLVYFTSRPAMNIVGVGEKLLRKLFDNKVINTPDDLYRLTKADILKLPGYGDKSAQNAIDSIDQSRVVPLRKFLVSLGIRNAAEGTAKRLALTFGSMENILSANLSQLLAITDVGPVVANSLFDHLHDGSGENTRQIIDRLMTHLTIENEVVPKVSDSPVSGKTFVVTGTLDGMSRDQAKSMIEADGGRVSGSVSKKTDYLLCGTDAGSKLDNAMKLGVPVISLDDYLQITSATSHSRDATMAQA